MIPAREQSHWFIHLAAKREWLVRANAGLVLLWITAALVSFDALPAGIPMHFTLDGEPTRWSEPTLLRWMLLPLLTMGLVLLLTRLERAQQWLNRSYQVGPPDGTADVATLRLRHTYLDACALLLIASMGLLHYGVWLVATGRVAALPGALVAGSVGAVAAVLVLIIPLQRAGAVLQARR